MKQSGMLKRLTYQRDYPERFPGEKTGILGCRSIETEDDGMDRRHALSVMGLFLAAALVLASREGGCLRGAAEDHLPKPPMASAPDAEGARRTLRTYFMDHYSEASSSAVFADLTHDGVEELLVLVVENSRTGEPASLHGGVLDSDSFTGAQVTVLRAGEDGEVLPIYSFACGAEHSRWGELYLKKEEGADYLVRYTPYTASDRGDFQLVQFSLGQDGAVLDRVREQIFFPAGEGETQAGDADEAEVAAFLALAESLLKDAEPVIVCDVIHDPITGTDGPRRFAYLDALFTSF